MTLADSHPSLALHADIVRRLEGFGVRADSLAWIIKAAHPAWAGTSPGMPDQSFHSVMRPEYRVQQVISRAPAIAVGPWDLILWRTPGDTTAFCWGAGPAGTNFETGGSPPASGCVYLQASERTGVKTLLTATAVANGPYSSFAPVSRPLRWRTQFASITAYLTASTLNDQGTVYAAQFARRPDPGGVTLNNGTAFRFDVTSVPFEENDMVLLDPSAATFPAKEGAYLPLRLAGPTFDFVSAVDGQDVGFMLLTSEADGFERLDAPSRVVRAAAGGSARDPPRAVLNSAILGQYQTGFMGKSLANVVAATYDGNENRCPVTAQLSGYPDISSGALVGLGDSGYDYSCQGVVIFRGLDPNASVTVKVHQGLEMMPLQDAPGRQFCQAPIRYDPKAIEAYYFLAFELKSAYPAKFNSLGTILGAIATVARNVWPTVQRVVPMAARVADRFISSGLGVPAAGGAGPVGRPVSSAPASSARSRPSTRSSRKVKKTVRLPPKKKR